MRALVLCLLLAAASGAARAGENVAAADWSQLCLATHGVQAEAFSRADKAGWKPLGEGVGRFLDESGGRRTLMFQQPDPNGPILCMVSHPSGGIDVAAALTALLGQPPTFSDGPWRVWVFDNNQGALTYLPNSEANRARDAFEHDRAVVVRGGVQQGLDVVLYEFKPAK